jgi:hypothetical protein
MSPQDEAAWRRALERKGRDWVTHELQYRVGQPHDDLLDVVYEAPHPTRAFCQRWCAEQEDKMAGLSPGTIVVMLILIIIMIASIMFEVRSLDRPRHVQTTTDMG